MIERPLLPPPSPAPGPGPDGDTMERAGRAVTLPLLVMAGAILGVVGLLAGLLERAPRGASAPTVTFVERHAAPAARDHSPAATSITPITSLTASCPAELGGSCSTTGSLYAPDADRIYIRARTGSSTATLNLVEWVPEDGKWTKVGADCPVTTDLITCRYVSARGARYYHVYKASGTLAFSAIEAVYGGAGLGSIEPGGVGSLIAGTGISITGTTTPTIALSTPVSTANGGTGLASFTANRLFYSSSTSAIGQLGCSDGQVASWSSGALVCATPSGLPVPQIQGVLAGSSVGTTERYATRNGYQDAAATTISFNTSLRVYVPEAGTWRLRATPTATVASGETLTVAAISAGSLTGTPGLALALTWLNADGAVTKSNTFSASVGWLAVSFLYSTTTYTGSIGFNLERVS